MITKQKAPTSFDADGIVVNSYEWKGLSTDSKPTDGVATNDIFTELDTANKYYFDGTAWEKFGGD